MIPFSGLLFFYLLFLGLLPAVVLGLLGKKLHYYGIFLCAAMLVIVFWQNGQLAALALFFLWEMALCCLFWRLPKRTRPALVGGGDSGAGAAGTHQAGGGLAALFPLPADGRQLYELSGGAVAAGHLRRAAAKAAAGGAWLLSSLFPGGQLRAHRPLPAVSLRPGPSARPRTLPHPAGPGHLEAGRRLRERRGNQRLYPAVLACRPAGKAALGPPSPTCTATPSTSFLTLPATAAWPSAPDTCWASRCRKL